MPIRRSQQSDGHEYNLILFALPVKGSIVEAKAIVDEVLEFLAKKPILIKDVFCLGKYARSTSMPNPAHPRPMLVI